MTRCMRIVGGVLLLAAFLGIGGSAWAYWTTGGTGSGSATTATLNPPTNVGATYTPGLSTVAVSWTASTGLPPQGYYVVRTNTSTGATAAACGSSISTFVTSPCTDALSAPGTYTYAVTAVYKSWSTTSGSSSSVAVVPDTTAPAVAVTTVNGQTVTFPYATNAPIATIGGTCGTAAGDNAAITPLVDSASTSPATATCTAGGTWTLVLTNPITTSGTYTLGATQTDLAGNLGTAATRTVNLDATAPTLTSLTRAGSAQAVNAGPLTWTATFSEPVSGVVASNFGLTTSGLAGTGTPTISTPTPTSGPPSTTWTVSVAMTNVTGSDLGSVALRLTGAGSIKDTAGNTLATTSLTGPAYTYDTTKPTVVSIARAGATASVNAGPLTWTVTFSEPVSGVVAARFALARSSGVNGAITGVASGTGSTPSASWAVTASVSGSEGTSRLDLTSVGTVQDAVGNALATTATGETYTYDVTKPTVSSIARSGAAASVNTGPLAWTVTFSEPVTGVDAGNFALVKSSGVSGVPSITAVNPDSGSAPSKIWTVTTSETGVAGANGATIGLNLVAIGSVTDAAGNQLGTSALTGAAYTYDTTPPAVTVARVNGSTSNFPYTKANVSSVGGACGATSIGDLSPVTVTITGAKSSSGTATCSSGTWSFNISLTTAGTLSVSATQSDTAGNVGTDIESVTLDKTAPTVSSVSSTLADGSYRAGQVIDVTVTFSEVVKVTGTPQLALATPNSYTVNYNSGSETDTLTFRYTVAAGHSSSDLNYYATGSLTLNGGTINDLATNAATRTLPSLSSANSLAGNKNLVIDTTAPTVTGVTSPLANGAYTTGQAVPITVTFSEPVVVTGTPTLTLSTGSPSTTPVDYVSGSGTNTLTFTYTVSAGNYSADLNYSSTSALTLNGGTIADVAGNSAALTLPGLTAAGSLGTNKSIVVDAVPPTVTVTLTNQNLLLWSRVRASGTAEYGGSAVTVYLCYNMGSNCTAGTATQTLTATVGTTGAWQADWSSLQGTGDWYAVATQTDAVGNVGTSPVFGPA